MILNAVFGAFFSRNPSACGIDERGEGGGDREREKERFIDDLWRQVIT